MMQIVKVCTVILTLIFCYIGYAFFFKDEDNTYRSEKNMSLKGNKIISHPPLNITGQEFNRIMKDGAKHGVVYKSLNDLDEVTKKLVEQALKIYKKKEV